jgi:hypothetical protein
MVRFFRYQLGIPLLLTGMACKEKGYRAVSLLLVLLCRPYAHCDSMNQLRHVLVHRFIQRVFNLSYGKQRGASVDILYDLFEKLDPVVLEASFYRHLQQMRRRGLIGRQLRAYMDSTIIEKSPNSTFEKAAWIKIRKVSYYGCRVALGSCLPRAPTDPYVHALVHTVPQKMVLLRLGIYGVDRMR